VYPFLERSRRRQILFKQGIVALTLLAIVGIVAASRTGRDQARLWSNRASDAFARTLFGLQPDRARIDAEWTLRRRRGIDEVRRSLTAFYRRTSDEMRALFQVAGMDPEHALIRYGRGDQAFVVSPQVFEPDEQGRSYRFRPNTRSVWLRQITIRDGPFSMFQVLDTPRHREAANHARALVDEGSIQQTNSWGLRGPEPDASAAVRGIVLGDSFMQAMFNGDANTPALFLERFLRDAWKLPVSILNTGHIGYSPEQYYFTLVEFGERFRPHFVVVSVCPNDFGDGQSVMRGEANWLSEADYWLGQIRQWCMSRKTICMVVGVPVHSQLESVRKDELYPSIVARTFHGPAAHYCFPLDEFIDEHLRLAKLVEDKGILRDRSQLYNRSIDDDHFSPRGAALWGAIVGRRLVRVFDLAPPELTRTAGTKEAPLRAPASPEPPG
jgi:hypothetical protein